MYISYLLMFIYYCSNLNFSCLARFFIIEKDTLLYSSIFVFSYLAFGGNPWEMEEGRGLSCMASKTGFEAPTREDLEAESTGTKPD